MADAFRIQSPDFQAEGTIQSAQVFDGGGCTGGNVSPELSWSGAPAATKSFAVTCYDPDAPTGSGWWHWQVFDLPASVTKLARGAGAPEGKAAPPGARQGPNDYGARGYGGPCPPPGDEPHHYVFTVFALKVEKLAVGEGASAAAIGFNLNANAIAKATVTGYYGR